MSCSQILGRLKAAAVFQLDDCMKPVYGEDTAYIDDCFAAFSSSDNLDEGQDFTRRCADGSILYYEPGEQSLQSVEVSLDLNAEPDSAFLAKLGMVTTIQNGATAAGFTRCTKGSANLLVAVWQEILGSEACTDEASEQWRLHLYPLRKARLTLEGDLGSEDSYFRITGITGSTANLGLGPIPFFRDAEGAPVFPTGDLSVCHHAVLTTGVAAPPVECGVIDTVDPSEEAPENP